MERIKRGVTVLLFFLVLWGFLFSFLALPKEILSASERRRLEQLPKPTVESVLSTGYMQALERYAQDHFPGREALRALKAHAQYELLGQRDSKGIYLADGSAVKIEAELKEDEVLYCADQINSVYERYLQGMKVYCAVIPDKNYFAAEAFNRPSLDYEQMIRTFTERLNGARYIDLFGSLSLGQYYRSDAHWRQEDLGAVRETLAKTLEIEDQLPPMEDYTERECYPFSGVYAGQSALSVEPDRLVYLTSPVLEQARVKSAEKEGDLSVYAPEKFLGMDGYDVFLHGAQAFLTIENPSASTERELILFRDSFGSSLAPLLLDAYSKITLIDLRYVRSDYLDDLISFTDQDVLFLYSTAIVNSGRLLR